MKKNIRVIARLDIKNQYLIKGINLEGLRKLGDPNEFAKKYYLPLSLMFNFFKWFKYIKHTNSITIKSNLNFPNKFGCPLKKFTWLIIPSK